MRKKAAPVIRAPVKALLLMGLLWLPGLAAFAEPAPTEYQIKAAFVYNFVKFVSWPPKTFAGPASPIVIGVLGKNLFGDNLEQAIHYKVIDGHPLEFGAFHSVAEATNCQVLFISPLEKDNFADILNALRGRSVLTVSETDGFCAAGGMVNFVIVDHKVRFRINNQAARDAGLTISSDLLSLAQSVR